MYVSIPTYTAAIDVETGAVIWEAGCGAGGSDDLHRLGPFLVVSSNQSIIFGAAEGEIIAPIGWQGPSINPASLRMFDNRVWARDSDGRWYFLDFSTTHPLWSEPADEEPSNEGHGDGGTPGRGK